MTKVIVSNSEGLFAAVTMIEADNWRVKKNGTLVVRRGNEEMARFKAHRWSAVRKEEQA